MKTKVEDGVLKIEMSDVDFENMKEGASFSFMPDNMVIMIKYKKPEHENASLN